MNLHSGRAYSFVNNVFVNCVNQGIFYLKEHASKIVRIMEQILLLILKKQHVGAKSLTLYNFMILTKILLSNSAQQINHMVISVKKITNARNVITIV